MERGRIQGLPKFFEYPLLSQERVKLRTSNLAGVFWEKMEGGRIQLQTSNFVHTFLVSIGTKVHYKFLEK